MVYVDIILGVLLYGAPGTGKTLLARACAAQTKSTFLKLAGPQLVQMFIGDVCKYIKLILTVMRAGGLAL
jgi:ATP-dependent 26S proteasome regulatory subunit